MTTKPKPVTLFGAPMKPYRIPGQVGTDFRLGHARVEKWSSGWGARSIEERIDLQRNFDDPHAAARALERKIEAQWKRLGKLMGKGGKR